MEIRRIIAGLSGMNRESSQLQALLQIGKLLRRGRTELRLFQQRSRDALGYLPFQLLESICYHRPAINVKQEIASNVR